MKKRMGLSVIVLSLFMLVGCDSSVTAKISGYFAVIVREIIPDYCLDDVTPTVAVVTLFQQEPFTVYVGEEIASQLEIGKQYIFNIREKNIGEITKEEFEKPYIEPVIALNKYNLIIDSVRLADEGEWGLDSVFLEYSIIADQ